MGKNNGDVEGGIDGLLIVLGFVDGGTGCLGLLLDFFSSSDCLLLLGILAGITVMESGEKALVFVEEFAVSFSVGFKIWGSFATTP